MWFIETYFGSCIEFLIGEWCDALAGCMEPGAGARATGGVMYAHGSRVQGVGAGDHVPVTHECCELFLLLFSGYGVGCSLDDSGPECGVNIVDGCPELCFGTRQVVEEITQGGISDVGEDGWGPHVAS